MKFRDRIVDFRRVKPADLNKHASNWRYHPDHQEGALTAMLAEVGFAGALLTRQLPNGELEIIDGHLRHDVLEQDEDFEVPVLVTDLNEEEAAQLLISYDPISAMAETDSALLEKLIGETEMPDHADIRKLLADLEHGIEKKKLKKKEEKENQHDVEGMALRPHEHYDYVVVLASTNQEWNALCDRLGLEKVQRHLKKRSVGLGRAIKADRLLDMLPDPRAEAKRLAEASKPEGQKDKVANKRKRS